MTQQIDNSLKEKIRKLLALQEGAHKVGSIQEAANAADKIRALLMKHNLDLYSIQKEGQEETTDEIKVDTGAYSTKTEGDWVAELAAVIAKFNLCTVIGTPKARSYIYLIGKPSNTELCWYIIEQLINRLRPMAREAFKVYTGPEKRNTFIRGFYRGAVQGIHKQLAEKARKEEYDADQDRSNGLLGTTALMTVNMVAKHNADNQAYIKARYRVKPGRATRLSSLSGRAAGQKAGYGMSINSGLKDSGSSSPKGYLG